MKNHVSTISVPSNSDIAKQLNGADFYDAYQISNPDHERSALQIYLDVVSKTPKWVNSLMALRNRVVSLFGLKDLGHLGQINQTKAANEYKVGDRVGIFSLLSINEQEIILTDNDNHLEAKVSVFKDQDSISVTTVVHVHNTLGKLYMALVVPVHKRIVPAMLARV